MFLLRISVAAYWLVSLIVAQSASAAGSDLKDVALNLWKQSDKPSGFVVHLGCADGILTRALRRDSVSQVHGIDWDADAVRKAREGTKVGEYGDVAFDVISGEQLPYVDNLVNLLVVSEQGGVSEAELLRVLTPGGVAIKLKADMPSSDWKVIKKPWPDTIDEWTHYLHDASGNAVAHDTEVGPPRHLQWVGSPRWSRHHDRMASMSALVSAGGRMFYVMDEGSRVSIQLPSKWKLAARDAFNGVKLWERDIPTWQNHLWPLKSGPTQLSRRLVASDDQVYATLGYDAPTTALNAATGETEITYEGSESTEEIIHSGNQLFLVVRKGKAELADYLPVNGRVGDQAAVRELFWNEEPRVLMAFDAQSGDLQWAKQSKVAPLTLCANSDRVFFHDGERVVCTDRTSGDMLWESDDVTRRASFTFNFGPRLVIHEDVVLYAGGDGKMVSLDAATGEALWEAEHPNSGYQSPQDLLVMNGMVWCAPTTSGKDSGIFTGRDPRTGEVLKEFPPDVQTYWFHHRCYIAKATDNFLMPSRTGIEFVDPEAEHWDINHWVRGGCLYGVMPCNGLTYAPPHNCACYPEAKLYGFNALAPKSVTRPIPAEVDDAGRHEKGAAFDEPLVRTVSADDQWPTYRHDVDRSGTTNSQIGENPRIDWQNKLGGKLTAPVIAGGSVYVSQVNTHTVHSLDVETGDSNWKFVAGGRVDSPPTISDGRVTFGCVDGWVYCLNARDGRLVWRYRAAPLDRRTMAYEQLESLWPVHGSVLVHERQVFCVAGRSTFLDGGLRLLRLDLATGNKLSETIMDETNPETGNNLQEKIQTLQMPVGLPDILTCDGRFIFMKSQKFDLEGNRLEIGPNSGDFQDQVKKQRGADAHIFAAMGFLDDSWFHRSYWVLGQSFAGGHGGYYQAGRFAPSGRILVKGNGYVFGYGRKPEYLRWTTTLEHQLFAAEPDPPEIPKGFGKKASAAGNFVQFQKSPSLNPAGKPITLEAWVSVTKPQGVIAARGGPTDGFALHVRQGKPVFSIRADFNLTEIEGPGRIVGGWHHIAGSMSEDKSMRLYVDGKLVAEGKATALIKGDPAQPMEIGADGGTAVGEYNSPHALTGVVDEVRLYFEAFDDEKIAARFESDAELSDSAVIAVGFDDGTARDLSLSRNNGTLVGKVQPFEGKIGQGIRFVGGKPAGGKKNAQSNNQGNTLVKPKWTSDVPIYVRGMVLSGFRLFIVGPPDIIDEESTFVQISEDDPAVQELLAAQDQALAGDQGAKLLVVDTQSGETVSELQLDSLPVWDSLAAAEGCLYLTTTDGSVLRLATGEAKATE